jgi:hypothetical protein
MAAETSRKEKVDRWIVLNAAELFCVNLVQNLEPFARGFSADDDLYLSEQRELADELWPDEAALETTEYSTASATSDALIARAFVNLAMEDSRSEILRDAARFTGLAARALAPDVVGQRAA